MRPGAYAPLGDAFRKASGPPTNIGSGKGARTGAGHPHAPMAGPRGGPPILCRPPTNDASSRPARGRGKGSRRPGLGGEADQFAHVSCSGRHGPWTNRGPNLLLPPPPPGPRPASFEASDARQGIGEKVLLEPDKTASPTHEVTRSACLSPFPPRTLAGLDGISRRAHAPTIEARKPPPARTATTNIKRKAR